MYTTISILIIIVCFLLILIVLVQDSKGGGLSSTFASSNQIMGVRKTTDFLEKATWTLAGALFVLSIVAAMAIPKGRESRSVIQEQINTTAPAPIQNAPAFPDMTTTSDDGSANTPN